MLSLQPQWIKSSEICIILHIIGKPNAIIILLFIQNIFKFLTSLPPRRLSSKLWLVFGTVSGYKQRFLSCRYFLKSKWHLKSMLSLIDRVNVVLNRTVVVDSNWRFNNLCGSHLQSQKVSCITSVDGIILWLWIWLVNYVAMLLVVCQLTLDVYWLWRLVISNWWVSIRLLSQLKSRLLFRKIVILSQLVLLDLVNKSFVQRW